MNPVTEIDAAEVRRLLASRGLKDEVEHHASCASTNDLVREALVAGGGESLTVVADHQSAGRGRFDRRWESAPGLNLLFSIGVRWRRDGFVPTWLTPAAALAAREAIEGLSGLSLAIKWPNDLVLPEEDRALKVAGILSDLLDQGEEWAAVVGMGINVNQVWSKSEQEPARPRGSLAGALGRSVSRELLLAEVISSFRDRVAELQIGDVASIRAAAQEHLWGLGRPARISLPDREWTAIPRGVDEGFRLIVETPNGTRETISAGDVLFGAGALT